MVLPLSIGKICSGGRRTRGLQRQLREIYLTWGLVPIAAVQLSATVFRKQSGLEFGTTTGRRGLIYTRAIMNRLYVRSLEARAPAARLPNRNCRHVLHYRERKVHSDLIVLNHYLRDLLTFQHRTTPFYLFLFPQSLQKNSSRIRTGGTRWSSDSLRNYTESRTASLRLFYETMFTLNRGIFNGFVFLRWKAIFSSTFSKDQYHFRCPRCPMQRPSLRRPFVWVRVRSRNISQRCVRYTRDESYIRVSKTPSADPVSKVGV